jgi:hypothetical protein
MLPGNLSLRPFIVLSLCPKPLTAQENMIHVDAVHGGPYDRQICIPYGSHLFLALD